MKLLVFATRLEADPFIRKLDLAEFKEYNFPIFRNEKIILIITGIGKAYAAMATCYALSKFHVESVVNLGAAGALKKELKLGEIFSVKKIHDVDRPHLKNGDHRFLFPERNGEFKEKKLATRDRAAIEIEDRKSLSKYADIIDMEGSAVMQTCKVFKKSCTLVKFISDELSHNNRPSIAENIAKFSEEFCENVLKKIDL